MWLQFLRILEWKTDILYIFNLIINFLYFSSYYNMCFYLLKNLKQQFFTILELLRHSHWRSAAPLWIFNKTFVPNFAISRSIWGSEKNSRVKRKRNQNWKIRLHWLVNTIKKFQNSLCFRSCINDWWLLLFWNLWLVNEKSYVLPIFSWTTAGWKKNTNEIFIVLNFIYAHNFQQSQSANNIFFINGVDLLKPQSNTSFHQLINIAYRTLNSSEVGKTLSKARYSFTSSGNTLKLQDKEDATIVV